MGSFFIVSAGATFDTPGATAVELADFYNTTRDARKVIVVDLGFLGDAVHLLPALWEIRRHYPAAALHALTTPVAAEVLALAGCADRLWPLELMPGRRSLADHRQVLARLRRERFDVAINLSAADRSIILMALTGARHRLGLLGGRRHFWNTWLIPHWLPQPDPNQPVFEQRRQALTAAGFALAPATVSAGVTALSEPPSSGAPASSRLEASLVRPAPAQSRLETGAPATTSDRTAPVRFDLRVPVEAVKWAETTVPAGAVHLSLNSANPLKEWPVGHYDQLAERLLTEHPQIGIVLSASGNIREQARLDAFFAKVRHPRVLRLPAGLTIAQLAAVLTRCRLHIGPDSGVIHLAMALGVPTIALFRQRGGYRAWLPAGKTHRQVLAPCDCESDRGSPCEKLGQAQCLAAIAPETVALLAAQLLTPNTAEVRVSRGNDPSC